MKSILNWGKNIRIFQMTKVGFEHWLNLSYYTLVVSTASLTVTDKADAC